jgi:hypothetical protein
MWSSITAQTPRVVKLGRVKYVEQYTGTNPKSSKAREGQVYGAVYWHSVKNIKASKAGYFPRTALQTSYMFEVRSNR